MGVGMIVSRLSWAIIVFAVTISPLASISAETIERAPVYLSDAEVFGDKEEVFDVGTREVVGRWLVAAIAALVACTISWSISKGVAAMILGGKPAGANDTPEMMACVTLGIAWSTLAIAYFPGAVAAMIIFSHAGLVIFKFIRR